MDSAIKTDFRLKSWQVMDVVVGIDPYGSRLTVFPDGRIARAQLVDFRDRSSEEAQRHSERYIMKQLSVRVLDVESLVAQVEQMNGIGSGDFFSSRLKLNRLGIHLAAQ